MARRFGPFLLDATAGLLLRDGVPVPLGHRGLLLLDRLVATAGRTVGKSELMEAAWPTLLVEESNLSVQVAALRKLLGPAPDGGEWIHTVPRVGYRFAPAGVAVETTAAPENERPTLAVLPLASLSDDPKQSFFAEGLTDDIVARLSRFRWLDVTTPRSLGGARSTGAEDSQPETRARYVLEGSVRRSEETVRVVCFLVEGASRAQLWSLSRDIRMADFLAVQNDIAEWVIGAIEPRLYAAEQQHVEGRPAESLDAWGLTVKAMPLVWTWGSLDDIIASEDLLNRALRVDPDYARANSLLAWTMAARVQLGHEPDARLMSAALARAETAIRRDPEDAWAHLARGYVQMVGRDQRGAKAALGEALVLNPSLAIAHLIMGSTLAYGGEAEAALAEIARAEETSPRDFAQPAIHATRGLCLFLTGRLEDAITCLRLAVALRPHFGTAWRTLTAAAGAAGDVSLARLGLARCLELQPSLSLQWVDDCHPISSAEHRALYVDGLRRAGLDR